MGEGWHISHPAAPRPVLLHCLPGGGGSELLHSQPAPLHPSNQAPRFTICGDLLDQGKLCWKPGAGAGMATAIAKCSCNVQDVRVCATHMLD